MATPLFAPGTWLVASAALRRPVTREDAYPHVHGLWVNGPAGRTLLTTRECWLCPAPDRRGAR